MILKRAMTSVPVWSWKKKISRTSSFYLLFYPSWDRVSLQGVKGGRRLPSDFKAMPETQEITNAERG